MHWSIKKTHFVTGAFNFAKSLAIIVVVLEMEAGVQRRDFPPALGSGTTDSGS